MLLDNCFEPGAVDKVAVRLSSANADVHPVLQLMHFVRQHLLRLKPAVDPLYQPGNITGMLARACWYGIKGTGTMQINERKRTAPFDKAECIPLHVWSHVKHECRQPCDSVDAVEGDLQDDLNTEVLDA